MCTIKQMSKRELLMPGPAFKAMYKYMAEHNYGMEDYPVYSQDPTWQKLNDALVLENSVRMRIADVVFR